MNEIENWAKINFNKLPYKDKRRTKRVIKIATEMARNTGESIPRLFNNFYDVKATYNIFKNEESKPETIQAQHRKNTLKLMKEDGEYLLLEDDSDISWTGKNNIDGLGFLKGHKNSQGFSLHSVLVLKWHGIRNIEKKESNVEVLGLLDQQYKVAPRCPKKNFLRRYGDNDLKTNTWIETPMRLKLPASKINKKFIRVCDREADIYEVMRETREQKYDFIIRAAHNRVLLDKPTKKLFDKLREISSSGKFVLSLRGRKGAKARRVTLNLAFIKIAFRAPQRSGISANQLPPIECTTIRVWEKNESTNKRLEWFLLTSKNIENVNDALEVIAQYACRWIIEDFHKALKSGTKAEKLQLEKAERLFAATAIMSIVALRLIGIRELLRIDPLADVSIAKLSELEIKVLELAVKQKIKNIQDLNRSLGKLGGHLGRKNDPPPGILTLWRALCKLNDLVAGYKLALELKNAKFG
jgi:hypothetical protein